MLALLPRTLPSRIAALIVGTVAAIAVSVAVVVWWLVQAVDDQAHGQHVRLVERALANTLDQLLVLGLDYSKWNDAADAVEAGDVATIYDNMGITATLGEGAQLVSLWGGPLDRPLGWTDDGRVEPDPALLPDGLVATVERALAPLPVATYEGASFFAWRGEELWAFAAARVERQAPIEPHRRPEDLARLLMGLRIDADAVDALEAAMLLPDLVVTREAPAGPAVPVPGPDGAPVAYASWVSPSPGSEAFLDILPVLLVGAALAAALVLGGTHAARRGAGRLVAAEREALAAARTDAMTRLPNRTAFADALAHPARAGERAILFLDVNGFKRINDSIGHEAGDRVIACVAERLAGLAGPDRFLARIAGDEFVFMVTGPDARERAERLAAAVGRVLTDPVEVLGHRMQLRMAMGCAVQDADGMKGDALVRQADLAMYEAKRRKDPGLVAFSGLIERSSRDALEVEQGLRAAMGRAGELAIAYQPIVAADGRLVRAEALARWTSPTLGPVPPDRFIAVAEQAGLMIDLGRTLFELVCDDLAAHPDLRVSVNVSPLQLMAPDFVPAVTAALRRRGIAPERVEVELTEAVVVDDAKLAAQRLAELHAAGLSTALDDFGTGYSSIGYLERMGFDTLKIDRSFVTGVRGSPRRLGMVNAMILMAHNLGLRVVCEGVETADELALLREMGCDLAQGFHLDRPLPIGALAERWLGPPGTRSAVA